MNFLKRVLFGDYSLAFTFWVMSFIAPTPIFIAKYYLKETGVLSHENTYIYLAGQIFLWVEWLFFAFITVAIWNASRSHIARIENGGEGRLIWGRLCLVLAVASGVLALGAFANLSGLTALIFGRPLYIGMGAG